MSVPPNLLFEDDMLAVTLMSVITCINYIINKDSGDQDSWKCFVVGIMSHERMSLKTREMLHEIGAFESLYLDEDVDIKFPLQGEDGDGAIYDSFPKTVQGRDVLAHLFEYSSQLARQVEGSNKATVSSSGSFPFQIITCLEAEHPTLKVTSDEWSTFFTASMEPGICIKIEAGTKVRPGRTYKLWTKGNQAQGSGPHVVRYENSAKKSSFSFKRH